MERKNTNRISSRVGRLVSGLCLFLGCSKSQAPVSLCSEALKYNSAPTLLLKAFI